VHDEEGFSIESRKNRANTLFARELLRAKPVAGVEEYRKILEKNRWVSEIYSTPYWEKLRALAVDPNGNVRLGHTNSGLRSFFLDWAEGITYAVLSRYLRLRAYLANLKLKSEGNNLRAFKPIISSGSCIYASNFYGWLRALWGD
jgi:hypothetical protein